MLNEETAAEQKILERLAAFGWYADDLKSVYVIRQVNPEKNPLHIIENYLTRINPEIFVVHYLGEIVVFLNHSLTDSTQFEEVFRQALITCGCIAGKSPSFSDMIRAKSYYMAARTAAGQDASPENTIVEYDSIVLFHALELLRENAIVDITHPAIAILKNYDVKHHTDFEKTIFTFLKTGCNWTETARLLIIHRSSLQYRLEKIQSLTGIDLTDYRTRFHLMLSFLLYSREP